MTGLDPAKDVILEIATIVTDGDLTVLAEGPDLAIYHPESVLATMEEWSSVHHKASGLLDRVRESEHDCRAAENLTLEFLSNHCSKGRCPLCGNSIWQDRRFLVKYMTSLDGFLHYRTVDVSSVKELAKRWSPELSPFKKQKAHLAQADIRESISKLKYYREEIFVSQSRGQVDPPD